MKCSKCGSENPDNLKFCGECGTQLPSQEEASASRTETLETPIEELSTGATFAGRYQIIEELGQGGMGRVYKVLDQEINAKVALKLIRPEISSDKKTIDRFRNELKTTRDISHRNVCRMYDINKDKGTYFITMEYVSGENLKRFITRSGQLTIGKSIFIAKQICDGLVEAHKLGIIHRDLKPGNIMVDKEGNTHIMDFGIARSLETKGMTGAGRMIGTPEYMSPEQAEAKEIDQRSDIYSLGIILYEMVTGQIPFEGDTPLSVAMKHKGETPKDPKALNPQIPEDLSQLILKCMEKEKDNRFRSAEELGAELEKIERGIPTTQREITRKKSLTSKEITVSFNPKKLVVPTFALIALILIVFGVFKLIPKKEGPITPTIENSVAVISFENQTGDDSYDYLQKAIPNLLITNLENTGFFHVATWERMHDILKQMGKEDVELIDQELGFDVCQKEGIEFVVLGSYIRAEELFLTDIKVLDVKTKKLIKSTTSRGEGVRSILENQIDELSSQISEGIGIARQEIDAAQLQVVNVTTKSMEAYDNFLKGRESAGKLYMGDARNFLEKAVEIDPDFSTAYLYLAQAYTWLNTPRAANEAFEKAMSLSDGASEKEKLYIRAAHARAIERDAEKSFQIYQEMAKKFPREKIAHLRLANYYRDRNLWDEAIKEYQVALELDPEYGLAINYLAYTYLIIGDYENAITYFKRYVSAFPEDANPYDSLAEAYLKKGNLDAAIINFKKAIEIKPDLGSDSSLGYVYALKEDFEEAIKWVDKYIEMAASPGRKVGGYGIKSVIELFLGDIDGALDDQQTAYDLAESAGNQFQINMVTFFRAWLYYERNEYDLSQKYLESWFDAASLDSSILPRITALYNFLLGLAEMKQGKPDSAELRLKLMESMLPDVDSAIKVIIEAQYYILKGEIALSKELPEEAISAWEQIPAYEMPGFMTLVISFYNLPPQKDVLARAYIQLGDKDKAITEYERLITFRPQSKDRFYIHPLYHYRLGILYEERRDIGKAIFEFEKFLDLWKNADSRFSEVADAKKRLAGLKKT